MEQAIDRYKELEKILGIDKLKEEFENLPKKEREHYTKAKLIIELFDEMKHNAVDFEYLKEMYQSNKIKLDEDYSLPYEEYLKKDTNGKLLMTKWEYDDIRRILYGRNNIN